MLWILFLLCGFGGILLGFGLVDEIDGLRASGHSGPSESHGVGE